MYLFYGLVIYCLKIRCKVMDFLRHIQRIYLLVCLEGTTASKRRSLTGYEVPGITGKQVAAWKAVPCCKWALPAEILNDLNDK